MSDIICECGHDIDNMHDEEGCHFPRPYMDGDCSCSLTKTEAYAGYAERITEERNALQAKLDIAVEALKDIDWSGFQELDDYEDMCRRLSKVACNALKKLEVKGE